MLAYIVSLPHSFPPSIAPCSYIIIFMAPIYPASLVEASFHSPALLELVVQKPNLKVHLYVANKTMQVVRRALQTSSHTGTLPHPEQFRLFVTNFFTMSSQFGLGMNVVLTALVLMHRVDDLALRKLIERRIEMQPCHLVFLSSVLTAIKAVHEQPPPMKYFLRWTSNLITESQLRNYEIDFLKLLDYSVNVSEAELLQYYHDVRACYTSGHLSPNPKNSSFIPHKQQAIPYVVHPHHQSTATRTRTISQPASADFRYRVKRQPSTGASAYPTPHVPPVQHNEPSNRAHYSDKRSRAPSYRAPTPYHASHQPHQHQHHQHHHHHHHHNLDSARLAAYPTPASQGPAMAPVIPVIQPSPSRLRRSKSQTTLRGKDSRQTGSSFWKKILPGK